MADPRFVRRYDGIIEAHVEPEGGLMDTALNDAVSSRAPLKAAHPGLSTYWIDRVERDLHAAREAESADPFASGNVAYLRLDGDGVIAGYDFDPDESGSESMPVAEFLSLLDQWRQLVVEAGGVSGPEAGEFIEDRPPFPMPPASST